MTMQTASRPTGSEYRFTGGMNNGVGTRIEVYVTQARVETDKRGCPYVIAQILLGVADHPVEVTMTIEEALAADIIEKLA